MSRQRDASELGLWIARVLRLGTLLAVAAIGGGLVVALLVDERGPGPTPLLDLVGGGGADALIGIGLVALTVTPVAALVVAAVALNRAGEQSRAVTAVGVLVLLGGSLAVAAIIGGAS